MRLAAIFAVAIAVLLSTSTPAQAQVRWSAQRPDNPPAFGTEGNFRFICRARVGRDWIPGRVADGATGCIVPDLQQSPSYPKTVAAFEWLDLPWGKIDRKCAQKTVEEHCRPCVPRRSLMQDCVCLGSFNPDGLRTVTREECGPLTATWSGPYALFDLQPNQSNGNIVTAGAGGGYEYGICIAEWGGRTELGAIHDTRCFIPVSPKVEAPQRYKAILGPKAAR